MIAMGYRNLKVEMKLKGLLLFLVSTTASSPLSCASLPPRVLLRETHMMSLAPSTLPGTWTSSRCETRPGPQFVLRRYTFHAVNGSILSPVGDLVSGVVYHYADPSCSQPLHSITMQGSLTIRDQSWLVPGGTEADFKLLHVWVRPYIKGVALKIQKKVAKVCPELGEVPWRTEEDYSVYTEGGKEDCLDALSLAFWEFQLFKLEQGMDGLEGSHPHHPRLLLGDLHSQASKRRKYRPKAYQPDHLVKYNEKHHTRTCRLVHNSSPSDPPQLRVSPTIPINHKALAGSWHSTRCEVRPHSLFVTRMITFTKDNHWRGEFKFFLDHFCSNPHFSVNVTGHYIKGGSSEIVPGGFNLDFHLEQASVTADSKQMTKELNSSPCGRGRWVVGESQDLTLVGGCLDIGLAIPSLSLELVKLEMSGGGGMALFLGQPNTDRASRMNSERLYNGDRSTAYQARMVRCRDNKVEVQVVEPLMLAQRDSYSKRYGHSHSDGHSISQSWILWLVVLGNML